MGPEKQQFRSDCCVAIAPESRGTEVISTFLKAEKLAHCRSGYKEQNKIGVVYFTEVNKYLEDSWSRWQPLYTFHLLWQAWVSTAPSAQAQDSAVPSAPT